MIYFLLTVRPCFIQGVSFVLLYHFSSKITFDETHMSPLSPYTLTIAEGVLLLESGCKSRRFITTFQIILTLFFQLFDNFTLNNLK
jgi:hypothetical protein